MYCPVLFGLETSVNTVMQCVVLLCGVLFCRVVSGLAWKGSERSCIK